MMLTNISPTVPKGVSDFKNFILNFAIPLFFLILIVVVSVFVISPTYSSIPALESEISTKEIQLESLRAKVSQLEQLESNRSLMIQDLTKLSWALEERDKVPELSEQVRLMSEDSDISFESLSYTNLAQNTAQVLSPNPVSSSNQDISPNPDPNLYREEKVDVKVSSANMDKFIGFLKTAENSIRLFRIEKFSSSLRDNSYDSSLLMASPYLNPGFKSYSDTSAVIDLNDVMYRDFMDRLDTFTNYAKEIDATLPKL